MTLKIYSNTGVLIAQQNTIQSGNTSNVSVTYEANGNVAIDTRISGGGGSGGGANVVSTFANNTLVVANANINFNNTATVNVAATANGTYEANIAFSANATALGIPAINATFGTLNTAISTAYAQANSQGTFANGSAIVANVSNINFNQTSTVNVAITANGQQTNAAFNVNAHALLAGVISGNTSNVTVTYDANGNVAIDTAIVTGGSVANATTSVRGITLLIDSISSTDTGNAATANAVAWVNTVAQTALSLSASAWLQANAANITAQAAISLAAAAYTQGNLAFLDTSTVNVSITANSSANNAQSNVVFTVNDAAVLLGVISGNTSNINITYDANGNVAIDTRLASGGGSGNYEVDVYANGVIVHTNANLNFINSTSMNSYVIANGTTQVNVSFNVNTTMNLVSLNVSGNVSNAANILVTSNVYTGNLHVTTLTNTAVLNVSTNANIAALTVVGLANATSLNVSTNTNTATLTVGSLANTVNVNVSSNIFSQSVNVTGNITVQNNIFVPNSSNIVFGGAAGNIANANMAVTWNVTANSLDFDATNGGSPGTPGFYFGSETNTGTYLVSTGSNTIGFSCNSNGVMNVAQGVVSIWGSAANSPLLSFNVSPTAGSANATLSAGNVTNKPGGANSTVIWIPILANGVTYYIPAWGK